MPSKDKQAYNAYMNAYMKDRWERRRADAVERLGGVCVNCGASGDLDFDHIDPSTKCMSMAKMSSASKVRFEEELSKCQLLCRDCHIEKTRRDRLDS